MTGPKRSRTIRFRLRFPGGSTPAPGAVALVKIEDVSAADRAAPVIASDSLKLGPEGLLSVDIPSGSIDPQASYSLSVHVSTDGSEQVEKGDFISPAIVPVLTNGEGDEHEVGLVRV